MNFGYYPAIEAPLLLFGAMHASPSDRECSRVALHCQFRNCLRFENAREHSTPCDERPAKRFCCLSAEVVVGSAGPSSENVPVEHGAEKQGHGYLQVQVRRQLAALDS